MKITHIFLLCVVHQPFWASGLTFQPSAVQTPSPTYLNHTRASSCSMDYSTITNKPFWIPESVNFTNTCDQNTTLTTKGTETFCTLAATGCTVDAGTVVLSYWPTGRTNKSYPTRVYVPEYNTTMTSGTYYVLLSNMTATNACGGRLGPILTNIVIPYSLTDIFTLLPYTGTQPRYTSTQQRPSASLTLSDLENCENEPSVTYDVKRPTAGPNYRCNPQLYFDTSYKHMGDPFWKDCGREDGGKFGIPDPPGMVSECHEGDDFCLFGAPQDPPAVPQPQVTATAEKNEDPTLTAITPPAQEIPTSVPPPSPPAQADPPVVVVPVPDSPSPPPSPPTQADPPVVVVPVPDSPSPPPSPPTQADPPVVVVPNSPAPPPSPPAQVDPPVVVVTDSPSPPPSPPATQNPTDVIPPVVVVPVQDSSLPQPPAPESPSSETPATGNQASSPITVPGQGAPITDVSDRPPPTSQEVAGAAPVLPALPAQDNIPSTPPALGSLPLLAGAASGQAPSIPLSVVKINLVTDYIAIAASRTLSIEGSAETLSDGVVLSLGPAGLVVSSLGGSVETIDADLLATVGNGLLPGGGLPVTQPGDGLAVAQASALSTSSSPNTIHVIDKLIISTLTPVSSSHTSSLTSLSATLGSQALDLVVESVTGSQVATSNVEAASPTPSVVLFTGSASLVQMRGISLVITVVAMLWSHGFCT